MAQYNDAPNVHKYFYLRAPLRDHEGDESMKQKKILKDDFLPHRNQEALSPFLPLKEDLAKILLSERRKVHILSVRFHIFLLHHILQFALYIPKRAEVKPHQQYVESQAHDEMGVMRAHITRL